MVRLNRVPSLLGRYGPWAIVAGASEGLGAAFAETLAAMGFNLVLVARREALLRALADKLERTAGTAVRWVALDLGERDATDAIVRVSEDVSPGLVVYNAAFAPIGPFAEKRIDELTDVIDVNIRAPLALIHRMVPGMLHRTTEVIDGSLTERRAGFILMSSLAGEQGAPSIATYAASKAFTTVLAQGLWHELKADRVDVTACCAGAVRTPGYLAASRGSGRVREAPGTMDAVRVAVAVLNGLGRRPLVVPGLMNKVSRFVMTRIVPTRTAIRIMAASTRHLEG